METTNKIILIITNIYMEIIKFNKNELLATLQPILRL